MNAKTTCLIDFSMKNGTHVNVIMIVNTKSLEVCKQSATNLARENPKVSFFFWTPSPNPISEVQTSVTANCYVFQTCTKNERTILLNQGNTYQLKGGK